MADRQPTGSFYKFQKGDKKRQPRLLNSNNDGNFYTESFSGREEHRCFISESRALDSLRAEQEALAARADRLCARHEEHTNAVLARIGRSFQPDRFLSFGLPVASRNAAQPSLLRRMQQTVLTPFKNLVDNNVPHPAEPIQARGGTGQGCNPSPPLTGYVKDKKQRNAKSREMSKTQRDTERGDEDNVWAMMDDEGMQTHLREQAWKVVELVAREKRSSTAMSTSSLESLNRVDTETPIELQAYLKVESPADVSIYEPAYAPTPPPPATKPRRQVARPGRFLSRTKVAGGGADKPRVQIAEDQDQLKLQVRLQPLADPDNSLDLSFRLLRSDDWEKKVDGLTAIRALAQHHSETLEPKLQTVCLAVTQEVKNLRSAVSRAAMATLRDMYVYLKKTMDCKAEETALVLLQKVSQSNAFIQKEANLALDAMVQNCSPSRVINALLNGGLSHRCTAVRVCTAQHLDQLADVLGAARVLTGKKNFTDRFLIAVSKMSLDSASDVRHQGHNTLQKLASSANFSKLWAKMVPQKDRDLVFRRLNVK